MLVGVPVGVLVGASVGVAVGERVGSSVGILVAVAVATNVGVVCPGIGVGAPAVVLPAATSAVGSHADATIGMFPARMYSPTNIVATTIKINRGSAKRSPREHVLVLLVFLFRYIIERF